jgi:hypothetical protein
MAQFLLHRTRRTHTNNNRETGMSMTDCEQCRNEIMKPRGSLFERLSRGGQVSKQGSSIGFIRSQVEDFRRGAVNVAKE